MDYYLEVEGLIVKVLHKGNNKKIKKINESALVYQIQKCLSTRADIEKNVDAPKGFFEDLLNGKISTLISFVEKYGLLTTVNPPRFLPNISPLHIFHLCAIGGFPEACLCLHSFYLLKKKYCSSSAHNIFTFGAIRGNVEILKTNYTWLPDSLSFVKQFSDYFQQPLYYIAARKKSQSMQKKMPAAAAAVIPPLLSISSSVVAAEVLRSSLSPVSLSILPSKLFDLVTLHISSDFRGNQILERIEKESGRKISTSVRVEAAYTAEQRTREYTYGTLLFDKPFTSPLIDVFDTIDSFVIEPTCELEESSARFFATPRAVGSPSIVSKQLFLQQFRAITNGFFDGFDFSNTVVIGGSVVGALLPIIDNNNSNNNNNNINVSLTEYFNSTSQFKSSDIDIYIYGVDNKEFSKKVEYIYNHLQKLVGTSKKIQVAKSSGAIVFIPHYPFRTIQIVIKKFTSVWQILTGVDIDCSAFAYNGEKLWTTTRGQYGMNYRWNITHPSLFEIRGTPSYEIRLVKYAHRGFAIIDREFLEKCGNVLNHYKDITADSLMPVDDEDYYFGAQLVAAADKWESVCSALDACATKIAGVPYGPNIGAEEVSIFLKNSTLDSGYGPSDSCLIECELKKVLQSINASELRSEIRFKTPKWHNKIN